MSKKAKEMKKKVLKGMEKKIGAIFEAARKAKTLSYKGYTSQEEIIQKPGDYSKAMTNAMIRDMMQLSLFMYSKDEGIAKIVKSVSDDVRDMDLALRRMFDDRKDGRPLTEYPHHKTPDIIDRLIDIKKSEAMKAGMVSHYRKLMDLWVEQISVMTKFAYCIECREKVSEYIKKAEMRGFDEEGNQVYGISEKDAETVKIMASMGKSLLGACVRIPLCNKANNDCMNMIEILNIFMRAIVDEDEETLEKLTNVSEHLPD